QHAPKQNSRNRGQHPPKQIFQKGVGMLRNLTRRGVNMLRNPPFPEFVLLEKGVNIRHNGSSPFQGWRGGSLVRPFPRGLGMTSKTSGFEPYGPMRSTAQSLYWQGG